MEGVIIQKGAFNPLHRMHKRIADDAIKRFPDYPHTMQMSMKTCDKGEIPVEELLSRCVEIDLAGYDATYTESGLFIDTIREVRDTYGLDLKIVFPCGEDTIYRFFRDWEDFYNKLDVKDEGKWILYSQYFINVIWYVSKRKCDAEVEKYKPVAAKYFEYHNNVVLSDLDLDDISSTKIRNGEVENE